MAKHLNNTHLLPRGRWATVQSETALRIVATLLSVASAVLDRARSARCTTRSKRGATSPTVSGFRMECGFRVTAQTSGCLSKKARRSLRRSGGKDEHSTSTWSPDASELCVIPSDYTEPGMSVVAKSRLRSKPTLRLKASNGLFSSACQLVAPERAIGVLFQFHE